MALTGMHGLQGLAKLRERWPGIPAVSLSSSDDRDTVLQAIEAGALDFIPKSSTPAVLIAALNDSDHRALLLGGPPKPAAPMACRRAPRS